MEALEDLLAVVEVLEEALVVAVEVQQVGFIIHWKNLIFYPQAQMEAVK